MNDIFLRLNDLVNADHAMRAEREADQERKRQDEANLDFVKSLEQNTKHFERMS